MTQKICLLCFMLSPTVMLAADLESLHDSAVLLWPEGAPNATGTAITDKPGLTIHLPAKDIATGASVVITPGGGFRKLASDNEGLHVARWLNSVGITAFVLRYRLMPAYDRSVAVRDAGRAVRYVRYHADTFGIDPERIGILGFSAGGFLASAVAIGFDEGDPDASDPIDRVSNRPDFSAPIYGGISQDLLDRVTAGTPPTFIVQTHEDKTVSPRRGLSLYGALLDNNVPAEMHVFGRGAHGTGLAPGDPSLGQWPTLLVNWLRFSGFLTSAKRIAVKGTVTIDGEPLVWGCVSFLPEDANAPRARVYSNGKFHIDAARGPVPGLHRVEVHVLSKDLSDLTRGKYTMDGPECYTKARPDAAAPIAVEVVKGQDIRIAITTEKSR